MEDIVIWRSAEILRKQYGDDASIMAAVRADQLLDEGDTKGFEVMRRVVSAINDLNRKRPDAGEPFN